MSAKILVIGDVMLDIIVRPEGELAMGSDRRARIEFKPGGSAANQAAWLAHFGARPSFIGRVGAGDHAEQSGLLRAAGVAPHLIADAHWATGRLIALIEASGERSFYTDRGANEALEIADIAPELIDKADALHLSGYSFFAKKPREAVLAAMAQAAPKPTSIDPASAEFLRAYGGAKFLAETRGAQVCLPNRDEAAVLSGVGDAPSQADFLARHYQTVVIKLGAEGCIAASGERRWRLGGLPTPIVDATGAGDAFAGAFLAARFAGEPMQASLTRAVAAGAVAAGQVGGRPPTRA